jgi:hypothetical protein
MDRIKTAKRENPPNDSKEQKRREKEYVSNTKSLFSIGFSSRRVPRNGSPELEPMLSPIRPLKTTQFRMSTPNTDRASATAAAIIHSTTSLSSPRRRRHKLRVKYMKEPFSTQPILELLQKTTQQQQQLPPSTSSSTNISRLNKMETPMGRASHRFPPSKIKKSKLELDEMVLGETITAVKALTNGSQVVDAYLKSLWCNSDSVCPRPIPPIMFNNDPKNTANGGNTGGGLITISEHQRVLAVILRDYTTKLSVAYRSQMTKSENLSSFKSRELHAKLQATLNAFRKTKEESYQQDIYIDHLILERDQLRTRVEKLEKALKRNNIPISSDSTSTTKIDTSTTGTTSTIITASTVASTVVSSGEKCISKKQIEKSNAHLHTGLEVLTRWKTPDPIDQEENNNLLKQSIGEAVEEKTTINQVSVKENEEKEEKEKGEKGEKKEAESYNNTNTTKLSTLQQQEENVVATEIDEIAKHAAEASKQVRADMREERDHAVKMRKMAIDSVKHSIHELELSISVDEEHLKDENEDDEHLIVGRRKIKKKSIMLDSLNDSLHELEETGFNKSRRGSAFLDNRDNTLTNSLANRLTGSK